jgi:hypothetical protein
MARNLKRIKPGRPIPARTLAEFERAAEAQSKFYVWPLQELSGRGWWGKLSGTSSPYSAVEVDRSGGSWTTYTGGYSVTSKVYEVNGISGLANKVVWIEPTETAGEWRTRFRRKHSTSSCNATLSGILSGCIYQGYTNPIPGIAWTATQSGSTVASGTTDASGTIAAFTVHSTAPVTMAFSGLPARAGIVPYNVTPICGSTVPCGTSINLSGSGAYVCIAQRSYQTNYCLYPIATTLYLTSPISGNLVTLSYVPSATLWSGAESYPLSPSPCGGGVTPVVAWIYYPDAGQLQGSYRCGSGSLVSIGSATMSHTCPTVSSGFTANGTFAGTYANGNSCPITE